MLIFYHFFPSAAGQEKIQWCILLCPRMSQQCWKRQKHGIKRAYFTFPHSDKTRRRKWLNAIPSLYSIICGDHFVGGMYANSKLMK